jgi:hypothetical protein
MNYIPDSVYTICGEDINACSNCSNTIYSPVVKGYVHDTLSGKVYCPFGTGNSMNQPIYNDQIYLNQFINPSTVWGKAPQLDPRSLVKVGLTWNTS